MMTFLSDHEHKWTVGENNIYCTICSIDYFNPIKFEMTKEEVEYFLKNISQEYINHDNYYESMNLIRRMRKFLGEV